MPTLTTYVITITMPDISKDPREDARLMFLFNQSAGFLDALEQLAAEHSTTDFQITVEEQTEPPL